MEEREGKALRIGEVVESSSAGFTAQCYRLYGAPPLGSLVRAGTPESYAVVYSITTQALDPARRIIARGEEEETEEEVYRSNPQLQRLLCTTFEALVVGHREGDALRHSLPPLPPRIHAFVYLCTPQEVVDFTGTLDFLHLMVNSGVPAVDEVVAACLRQASNHHPDGRAFLVQAGKVLALELAGQLQRLNAILRRLSV
jgi:hypothetical protein